MASWGGWVYAPDYYPSGELLFQTGAGSNSGSYSDKKNDALIHDTNFGDASLAAVAELPRRRSCRSSGSRTTPSSVTEIRKDLQGVDAAEPAAQHQPGELVLHEVADSLEPS